MAIAPSSLRRTSSRIARSRVAARVWSPHTLRRSSRISSISTSRRKTPQAQPSSSLSTSRRKPPQTQNSSPEIYNCIVVRASPCSRPSFNLPAPPATPASDSFSEGEMSLTYHSPSLASPVSSTPIITTSIPPPLPLNQGGPADVVVSFAGTSPGNWTDSIDFKAGTGEDVWGRRRSKRVAIKLRESDHDGARDNTTSCTRANPNSNLTTNWRTQQKRKRTSSPSPPSSPGPSPRPQTSSGSKGKTNAGQVPEQLTYPSRLEEMLRMRVGMDSEKFGGALAVLVEEMRIRGLSRGGGGGEHHGI